MMEWTALTGRDEDREGTDFYPTPPDVTLALLQYLNLPVATKIWEPACGAGMMVKVFEDNGMIVHATDLHDRGYGSGGVDFTRTKDVPDVEWIITNPPFSLAEQFILTAAKMPLSGGFALLLKSQFWHAARRLKVWEMCRPTHILPLTWRPDFLFGARGGASVMECIWCVWDWDFIGGLMDRGQPIYCPLPKPTAARAQAQMQPMLELTA